MKSNTWRTTDLMVGVVLVRLFNGCDTFAVSTDLCEYDIGLDLATMTRRCGGKGCEQWHLVVLYTCLFPGKNKQGWDTRCCPIASMTARYVPKRLVVVFVRTTMVKGRSLPWLFSIRNTAHTHTPKFQHTLCNNDYIAHHEFKEPALRTQASKASQRMHSSEPSFIPCTYRSGTPATSHITIHT